MVPQLLRTMLKLLSGSRDHIKQRNMAFVFPGKVSTARKFLRTTEKTAGLYWRTLDFQNNFGLEVIAEIICNLCPNVEFKTIPLRTNL